MLAVCAQWVDQDHQLRKALLGLPECPNNHSGEAQAALIAKVLRNFNISKVGYHTGDNATSNDTCLESLSRYLKAELKMDFDPKRRRIRCIGHIINISLQSFLLARSKEALAAALDAAVDSRDVDALDHFSTTLAEAGTQQEELSRKGKRTKSIAKAASQQSTDENHTGW